MRSNKQLYDLGINTDCFRALDKIEQSKVTRRRQGQVTTQPRSNYGKVLWELGYRAWLDEVPVPEPPEPEPEPEPKKRYAPRTHNLGGHDQDPRFCMKTEYGVTTTTHPEHGYCYVDEMGVHYDIEHGLDLDGSRERGYMVDGLKGADSMDGLEPCDAYVGPTGLAVPPYPGDPYAQTGSYHR
jgi:hypothetical protein